MTCLCALTWASRPVAVADVVAVVAVAVVAVVAAADVAAADVAAADVDGVGVDGVDGVGRCALTGMSSGVWRSCSPEQTSVRSWGT